MNKINADLLNTLASQVYVNQRELAKTTGYSLGAVNNALKELIEEEYLDEQVTLTEKSKQLLESSAPKNAIILAAGFGMRMVPINMETSKGLLEVNGEPLVERLIKQLHEVGVKEIYVVVGFMKEQYEYLIDEYGVELIVNSEYASKNNLHSMKLVASHLANSYIVPCDIWCRENPFRKNELYSWYMVSDEVSQESSVRVNRKNELVSITEEADGNAMIGISYLIEEDAKEVKEQILKMDADAKNDGAFWEMALYQKDKMFVTARVMKAADVVEINTYEQLRELDGDSNQLRSDAISIICEALNVNEVDVTDITVLKKGMTNRSFLFTCEGQRYIMRIPGEGTDQLINRAEEAAVYQVIADKGICDDIIYINPNTGYKITKYLEGARVCDAFDEEDLKKCMGKLRKFHKMELRVDHEFDIFKLIEFYESLWEGKPSVYRDYQKTKERIFELKTFLDKYETKKILTHIDANNDNFLFAKDANGEEILKLIDWEYAGMQDPDVDIAMFCIYAMYDKECVDRLIDIYFEEKCPEDVRIKIYGYIAACGLLWSNWCEYKRNLGVEFGEYSLRQYRYAKEYYRYFMEGVKPCIK